MPILLTLESLMLFIAMSHILIGIYQNKPNVINFLFALLYLPLLLTSNLIGYDLFMLSYPLQWFFGVLFAKLSYPKSKITSLLYLYVMLFSLGAVFTSVAVVFFHTNVYYLEAVVYALVMVVASILAFSKAKFFIQQTIRCTPKVFKILILCICVLLAIINSLIHAGSVDFENDNWLMLIQVLAMLIVVSFFVLLPILINHSVKNEHLKQLTENYENQMEAQAKHYEAVAKSNWEIRRFQHDTKNLSVGLTNLLENGQQQEALEMLHSYYDSSLGLKDVLLQFDTGNGIVDALLADKQQSASVMNTKICFEGMVPAGGISPSDLCVLFGNTLDNALDACAKFPVDDEKTIDIVSKSMGGYLWLTIRNPVVENVKINNNAIATTKEDKNHHGFGLYSLQMLAKKHNGELKLTCENKVFEITIELNIEI